MDDLISRQAAIAYAISGRVRAEDGEKWIRVQEVRESLLNMPSAQPELIEKTAYIRGFEQGRTQGMIDSQSGKKLNCGADMRKGEEE